jgi:hypothetical protein
MKKGVWLVLIPLLISTGCSTFARFRSDDTAGKDLPPTLADDVQIYVVEDIGKKYEILGPVVACADSGNSSEKVVALLKTRWWA